MDSTTAMLVQEILKNGYYRQSQTLGEGGWSKIPNNWKKYVLTELIEIVEDDCYLANEVETITAKDDETAIKAFSSLYHLNKMIDPQIDEKVISYRRIK